MITLKPKTLVTGVAIRIGKEVFACACPFRHADIIRYLTEFGGKTPGDVAKGEQGFVNSYDKFLSREEAYEVARIAGQLKQKTEKLRLNSMRHELFSEDLW